MNNSTYSYSPYTKYGVEKNFSKLKKKPAPSKASKPMKTILDTEPAPEIGWVALIDQVRWWVNDTGASMKIVKHVVQHTGSSQSLAADFVLHMDKPPQKKGNKLPDILPGVNLDLAVPNLAKMPAHYTPFESVLPVFPRLQELVQEYRPDMTEFALRAWAKEVIGQLVLF